MNPDTNGNNSPAWAKGWLRAAGVYNLVWGAIVIAFPHLLFDASGIPAQITPKFGSALA